jgi:hypothetical protein
MKRRRYITAYGAEQGMHVMGYPMAVIFLNTREKSKVYCWLQIMSTNARRAVRIATDYKYKYA